MTDRSRPRPQPARIVVDRLSFRYRPGTWVFRDHSFAVEPGDVWAILGPNGRGKTTLLKCVLGLLRPTEGAVRVAAPPAHVPQQHRLAFDYTVLDVVLMGRARHIGTLAGPSATDLEAARTALDRVGLSTFAERWMSELSGGEHQLALVARALASASDVLILDEPAASLDLGNQKRILALLRDLAAQGLSIVFTTHDPHHAVVAASSVLAMIDADRYAAGPVDQVLSEAQLATLYGVPLRRVDVDHGGRAHPAVVPILD